MKRFWRAAVAETSAAGWRILLDDRPLKTPARSEFKVPHERLAAAVAREWDEAAETVDPRAMPLTGLANAAIDQAGSDVATFAAAIARYAEVDLLCYRAESPAALVARQARHWDPLLQWAGHRFDVAFEVTAGVAPVVQPAATIGALSDAVRGLDSFQLAGLSPLVTIGGSLVVGLALIDDAVSIEAAWQAVSVDEQWQIDQWGEDREAAASLAARNRDFVAAKCFLDLLG